MKRSHHLLRLTFYVQWGTLFQTWFQLGSSLTPIQFLAFMVRLKFRPQRTHGKISNYCTMTLPAGTCGLNWADKAACWNVMAGDCTAKITFWAHNWLKKRDKPWCIYCTVCIIFCCILYIWRTRVCWALLCLCHLFIFFRGMSRLEPRVLPWKAIPSNHRGR